MDALPLRDLLDASSHGLWDGRIVATAICLILAWLVYLLVRTDPEHGVDFSLPPPEQAKIGWQGKELPSPSIKVTGSNAIQCYAPATGQLISLINPATPDKIDRLIVRAAAAQSTWSKTTFAQRRKVLKTLLKFILDNEADIIRTACLDSGKTRVDALFGEILVTAEKIRWMLDHGEKSLSADGRSTNLLMFYKKNEIRYEPLGVVAACVSWNYPFHNFLGPVISSIFAGNAIVVKTSEQTAWSSVYFANIVRGALSACGFDPDVVQGFACWPETAEHFTSHPGLSHLTFIGSRPVAHAVAKSASKALTPLCVELGGKDAAIVLDDTKQRCMSSGEMERVCSILMRGVFQSSGQNCVGTERIIAQPKSYERLIEMLEPRIKGLRLGNDLDPETTVDCGALISPTSFDRLEHLIAEATASGARLLVGGHRFTHEHYPQGHYFTPTLIVDVTSDMRIAQEELFAPVCVLMRAESVDETIEIANSTAYGLGASVYGPTSTSRARDALNHVANGLKVGMVAENDLAAYYVCQLPFGGVRGSGYGRFAGQEGLRSVCNAKSICVDRWPSLIKTSIPANLDYPMREGAWRAAVGVVFLGYGENMPRRWQGIRRLVGF
ncbi:related to oxidoreductase (Msc7) [Ramularia collo-cygni]|uniref:aldehyde dehydrogenase (NAD(+)) n=1 Tax=Ramularia collo-cygni TaxID=112498 RepID=A0A2D3V2D6_9PEZI|nr:related to oxidoreductase (Msc7) [Ramularia collo-cygni]CZT15669.1 related to oxidoreductase (Msc7) [Ramularia collo-cygni]